MQVKEQRRQVKPKALAAAEGEGCADGQLGGGSTAVMEAHVVSSDESEHGSGDEADQLIRRQHRYYDNVHKVM